MSKFVDHNKLGKKHGYSECCIKSFINENRADNATEVQKKALDIIHRTGFRGFVPCDECSKKICDRTYKKLTDLIKRESPIRCWNVKFGNFTKKEKKLLYKNRMTNIIDGHIWKPY